MYETIMKTSVTGGNSETATVGAGHLNGIFIAIASGANRFITVRLRTSKGTRVLAQDVPTHVMKHLDASRTNGTRDTWYNVASIIRDQDKNIGLVNAVHSTPATLVDQTFPIGSITQYYRDSEGGIFMDLGSIYLNKGDELAVTVRLAAGEPAQEVTVMTYSQERDPYHLTSYEFIKDDQVNVYDAMALYAFYDQQTVAEVDAYGVTRTTFVASPDVQVKSGDYSYIASFEDIFSAESARTNGIKNIREAFVTLWTNTSPIPESIDVRCTGEGSENMQFLNVQKIFIQSKTTASNVDELEKLRTRLERLERQEPEKAKALRHAGDIPKAEEVAQAVGVMETGDEKEGNK